MADKDDNGSKVLNELNSIKNSLTSTNPTTITAVQSKLEDIKRNNPNLASEIANLIKSIEQELLELKERGADVVRVAKAQEATAQQDHEEIKQIIDHQHSLHETKALQQEYDSFKDDFVKKLQDDNALLRKAANPEDLTEDEQTRLTRTPRNEAERLEFEKLDKEIAERWEKHYQLKDNYSKLIKHSENNIKKYQENLKVNNHLPQKVEKINGLISTEKKHIIQHKENLEKLKPAELEREEDRKVLLEHIKNGVDPRFLKHKIQDHHKNHYAKYKKEVARNPSYKGLQEFEEILQKTGFPKDVIKTKERDLESNNSRVVENKKNTAEKSASAASKDHSAQQENIKETSTIKRLFSFTGAIFLSKTKEDNVRVQMTTQTTSISDISEQPGKSYVNAKKFSPEVALETEKRIARLAKPNPKSVGNQVIDEAIYRVQSVQLSYTSKDGKENKIELHSLESEIRTLNIKKPSSHPLPPPKSNRNNHKNNNRGI